MNSHTSPRGSNPLARGIALALPALLSVLLMSGAGEAAAARAPVTYGEEFVRAGRDWPDGRPGQIAAAMGIEGALSGTAADGQAWNARLEQLELAGGPYANELAEPLAGLAGHYRSAGDLATAQQLYRRALHVVRINDGLYSERQVPIVRALLDSFREAGDLEQLDQRYDYFFRLYGNGQPPYTDLRLGAALEYLRWQREALRRGVDGKDNGRLLDLYYLNEDLLHLVEVHGPIGYALYREAVLSQLRNLYLVQARITPKIQEIALTHYNPMPGTNSGGLGDQDFDERRLETIQRSAVSTGAALLEQLLAKSQGEGPGAVAAVRLELADWYQWNGAYNRAREHYAEVERGLREAGESELLREWLAQPRELPDNGAFWQPRARDDEQRRVTLRASFDVSSRGRAQNIQVQARREDDQQLAWRLRRQLAKTPFRPRIVDGVGEAAGQLVADYEVID